MKMRSLKNMAILFAVATMTTSSAFAGNFVERHINRCGSSSDSDSDSHRHTIRCKYNLKEIVNLLEDAQFALSQVGENLDDLFNMEGTLFRNRVNPFTPTTGVLQFLDAINGTGPGSNGQAAAEILRILNLLIKDKTIVEQIRAELTLIIGLAEKYAFDVNTNAPIAVQQADALAWGASAQKVAQLLQSAGVTSFVTNPITGQEDNITGLFGDLIVIQSQLVQAYAGVLNGANNVGAVPGNLASQMNAAVALSRQVSQIFAEIGALVVVDLTCPGILD